MANGRFEWGNDSMTKENLKNVLTVVRDIINRSSETGIRKAQAAEKQAYNAQAAANAAQTTADNAQATANAAQTTAENALPLAGGKMTGNIVIKEGVGIQADVAVPHRILLNHVTSKPDVAFEKYATNYDKEISLYAGFTNMEAYNSYVQFVFAKGGNTASLALPSPSSESTLPSVLVLKGANNEHTSVVVDNVNTIVFRKNSLSNDYYHLKADDNGSLVAENFKGIILNSSTAGSTKKFRITVDDSGTLTTTEVIST